MYCLVVYNRIIFHKSTQVYSDCNSQAIPLEDIHPEWRQEESRLIITTPFMTVQAVRISVSRLSNGRVAYL